MATFLWPALTRRRALAWPLPPTVSFFTKRARCRAAGRRRALLYGASIVVIYVALGRLSTVAFGADTLNTLANNGLLNLFFFGLLVVFAASFLGAFEPRLPGAWAPKAEERADRGGRLRICFLAATPALVSLSYIGPLMGTLPGRAATTGQLLGPAAGVLGFAGAVALLSLFAGWLAAAPKPGGGRHSAKVVLGFLALGLSLKFLSNADLAYHWQWLDRELFLVVWVVLAALLGFYLLGELQFSPASPLSFATLPRLLLATAALAFTVYLVPGLWGAPLQAVATFLPPQTTQDFDLYAPTLSGHEASGEPAASRTMRKASR